MQRSGWLRPVLAAAGVVLSVTARGDLIVYEGFDCAAANNTRLDGLAGAASFGFDAGSAWTNAVASGTNVFRTAGRTFGNVAGASLLKTTGGSAYGQAGLSWNTARLSRPLDVAANTIWGSFLLERDVGYSRWVHSLLLSPAWNSADNTADVDIAPREFWNTAPGAIRMRGNQQYASGASPADDTTCLVLYKVTNLNAASGSSVATQWVLSNAQYLTHKRGGLIEAELNAATLGTGAAQVMQRGSVTNTAPAQALPRFAANGHLVLFSAVSDAGQVRVFYDELRISNASLDDVTPLGPGAAVENSAGGLATAPDAAVLRGTVVSPGNAEPVDAYVYWGQTDGGTNAALWSRGALVAAGLSGVAAVGTNLAFAATGLIRDQDCSYRYALSNAAGRVWAPASSTAAGTFSTDGYLRRMPITFDGYAGREVLTNFPALVRLSAAQVGPSATSWHDVRFVADDGQPLFYEVDSWDATDGYNAWVRIPFLTSATRIWLYNDAAVPQTAPSRYAQASAVWTGGHAGVWHFNEQVVNNQTSASHTDATGNGLAARQNRNETVAGVVARAQRTVRDGTNSEYMRVTNTTAAALDVGSFFTLSGWLRWEGAAPAGNARIVARKNAYTDADGWEAIMIRNAGVTPTRYPLWLRGPLSATTAQFDGVGTNPPYINAASGDWWHAAFVYQGTTVKAYVNGVLVGSGNVAAPVNNDRPLTFGNIGAPDANNTYNGDFDEWRLDWDDRSADWIHAVWKNMAQNSAFQTYGLLENKGATLILLR